MNYYFNPLNIRYSAKNNWLGQAQPKNGFCQFDSLYYGFRAAAKILMRSYRALGLVNVYDVVKTWAPSSDGNNVRGYFDFCSRFNRNECADLFWLDSYSDYKTLMIRMFRIEQGREISSSELIVLNDVITYAKENNYLKSKS